MKIRFTKIYAVKDGTGTAYKEGDVLDCGEASAMHFITRGVAAVFNEPEPVKEVKEKISLSKGHKVDK